MERFEIIAPSPRLAPYIKQYWFLQTDAATYPTQRLIPTGCVSLIFHRGAPLRLFDDGTLQAKAFVGGISSSFNDYALTGHTDIVCILFRPFGAAAFFREPLNLLKEAYIPIELLEAPEMTELRNRLGDQSDNRKCVEMIERTLANVFDCRKEYNIRRMAAATGLIDRGETAITTLARESCLSEKQFRRVFNEYIGVNPQELVRIVRFQRTLYTMQSRPNLSFAQLAYECNYSDQAHMDREFKLFSGYTPRQYLACCAPYSDYFA